MKTYFCRVDDRLLHGQLTAAWARKLSLTNIFIVDNILANDKNAVKVMMAMAPQRVAITVLPVARAVDLLRQEESELFGERVLCLLGSLQTAAEFLSETKERFSALNLGGLTSRVGRHEVGKNLFLSNEERQIVLQIAEEYGLPVIQQILPGDPPVDVGARIRSSKVQEG